MTEIEKGNKLIGEFMDTKLWCFTQGSSNILRAQIHISEYAKYKKRGYTRFDLFYKSDWNSLMEVIDKIETIGYSSVYISNTGCSIKAVFYDIKEDAMVARSVISIKGKDKLESTWLTVVEFIKLYNKYAKKKNG